MSGDGHGKHPAAALTDAGSRLRASGAASLERSGEPPEEREARYRALVDATAQMVWTARADGLVDDVPFWRELTGQTPDDIRENRWVDAVHPADRDRVSAEWLRAASSLTPYNAEYRLRLRSGAYRRYRARAVPVLDDAGRLREWVGVFEEIDPSATRERLLLSVARGLGDALSPREIAEVVLANSLEGADADAGAVAMAEYDSSDTICSFEVLADAGYDAAAIPEHRRFDPKPGGPLTEASRTRTPVFAGSAREIADRFPALPSLHPQGFEAYAAIPVVRGGRSVAIIFFSYRDPQDFDERTRTFLASLAELCAQALGRAELLASERAAREQSDLILSTIHDGFVALDRDLRYSFVNRAAEEMLRRPAAALYGQKAWAGLGTDEDTPISVAIRRAMADQQPRTIEAFSAPIDRWLELHIYPTPSAISIIFRDVTDRRRARRGTEFLADAGRILASSLDYETTITAVVRASVPALGDWCAVDLLSDPGSTEWPPRIERIALHHADPERLALGRELERRFPTDWSSAAGLATVIRDGVPLFVPVVTDEMIVAGTKDPEQLALLRALQFSSVIVVPLEARGVRLGALTLCMTESARHYDEHDFLLAQELARRAALAVDNARLYRDAERLYTAEREARADADRANTAKTAFLRTMSHELRTPLGVIGGMLDLWELGTRGELTALQREDIARMRRNQEYLLGLITDILDLARIEAGRVELDLREVRAREVLDDVATLTGGPLEQKGVSLDLRRPPESLVMRADRARIVQVIVNLVSNALKATPPGGTITLAAHPAPGAMVQISVADTGVGIPADKLEAIFEPFVQLGRSLSSGHEGTGLGLSISRELARAMRGEITATSRPGAGAVFTIALPAA